MAKAESASIASQQEATAAVPCRFSTVASPVDQSLEYPHVAILHHVQGKVVAARTVRAVPKYLDAIRILVRFLSGTLI